MVRKDALWKGIIEDLVEDFVHFFFPDVVTQIDFDRGFTFLDKELEQLSRPSKSKLRHADKLFKAWLKNGQEQWFLIHIEVQGYPDPAFAKRMYQYAYRIEDRFDRPLTALAIYTGSNRKFHYTAYRTSFMGTELTYHFRTYIVMDQEISALRSSDNLFGLVMEVAYRELDHGVKGDEQRLHIKTELARHLINRGINKQKIRNLLDFIKYYIRFEQKEFLNKFEQELQSIIKSRQAMGIREAILHDVKQSGFEEGQAAGIEQGIEKGIEQGIEKGIEKIVKRAWQKGMTIEAIAELADISLEKTKEIIQELLEPAEETTTTNEQVSLATAHSKTVVQPELDPEKHSTIIHTWQKGLSIKEIANLTGLPEALIIAIVQEK